MPSIFTRSQRFLTPRANPGTAGPGARLLNLLPGRKAADLDILSKRIILPSLPVADEDMTRLSLIEQGRRLARQELWDEISALIRLADDARLATPGGFSEATLLVLGAHGDVVAAAADALADGRAPRPDGLAALDQIARETPENYPCTLVAAMAYLRIAEAWRTTTTISAAESGDRAAQVRAHSRAARDLLAPFDACELDAPSLAAAACALAEGSGAEIDRIIAAYTTLIRLDPHSPQSLRQFGRQLVTCQGCNPGLLDDHAHRFADETAEIWGNGAYVWVWIDALRDDPTGLGRIDTDRFIAGLQDILRDTRNQHIVNDLAVFCAIAMAPPRAPKLPRAAERARAALHACQDWILARHLYKLHPYVWAEARPTGLAVQPAATHRALVARGRKTALHLIARRFADQLADGSSIAFSPSGMYRLPAF